MVRRTQSVIHKQPQVAWPQKSWPAPEPLSGPEPWAQASYVVPEPWPEPAGWW